MRRRFETYKEEPPKLVKLMGNPGVDQNYTIEKKKDIVILIYL